MFSQVLGIQSVGLLLSDIYSDDIVGDGIGFIHLAFIHDIGQRGLLLGIHKFVLGHVTPGEVLVDVGRRVVDHLTVEPVAADVLILILLLAGQFGIFVAVIALMDEAAILQIHLYHMEGILPVRQ